MVLTKVDLPRTTRPRQPLTSGGLWVRRTRFHEPAMQDPSKDADGLPQKGFAKKKKDEVGKKRQNHHGRRKGTGFFFS